MKKLFGQLNITWWKVILFAVIAGVYTGVMAAIPAARDTSFQDISISFEWWILFAIILIVNSKSPLDSALKTFVFFLISQPLVYLVQVPFNDLGFGLFRYYPPWFIWTLATFPMAFVGYYMRKEKWWSLAILVPMLFLLGYHYVGFIGEAVYFFPNHLLSAIFCAATMIIYPLCIFHNKKLRMAGAIISAVILLAATVLGVMDKSVHTYNTQLLVSGGETTGVEYDDSYTVYLEDERYGEVHIEYMDSIESYMVVAAFEKTGKTRLILESPDGEKYVYNLTVGRDTYTVERQEDDNN